MLTHNFDAHMYNRNIEMFEEDSSIPIAGSTYNVHTYISTDAQYKLQPLVIGRVHQGIPSRLD